jgi:segregation and condensation protein A
VIDVIDRFLGELGLDEGQGDHTQTDLPKSGQTFLWASMLVLLKADTLERTDEVEELEDDFEDGGMTEEERAERRLKMQSLETVIKRRPAAPPPQKRRVTLQELIEQLEQIAEEIEGKPISKQADKVKKHTRKEAKKIVSQLAHNENLTEIADKLSVFFGSRWHELAQDQKSIKLDQLLAWWEEHQPKPHNPYEELLHPTPTRDRVGVFWGLLLLSAQSKVELHQEEFYQEITITPIVDPSTLPQFEQLKLL